MCRDFDAWSAPGSSGAEVRTWAAYPDHGVVVLNMQGNRFCENVDRAHKSNNVVFAIDLREGAYYQRCHDPECRGYRGRYRALPSELAREAVALRSLGGGGEGEGEGEGYAPPRIDSDDDDDEDGFWAAGGRRRRTRRRRRRRGSRPRSTTTRRFGRKPSRSSSERNR